MALGRSCDDVSAQRAIVSVRARRGRESELQTERELVALRELLALREPVAAAVAARTPRESGSAVYDAVDEALAQVVASGHRGC